FEALRRRVAPRSGVAAGLAVALAIAIGGAWYFHRVTPPLLAQSSVGIALRALGEPPREAVFLTHSPPAELDWLYVDLMAAAIPAEPIEARPYQDGAALIGPDGRPRAELFFYSPALEQDERVTAGICARFAGAALYVLRDPAGISASHAARPAGGAWLPALPAPQWEVSGCGRR
ncbi:MAG: hypothetical protein HKP30_07075, partial [Myxococcales bacterium]|nr:hypothetical protein [Myxococcales bacterium]